MPDDVELKRSRLIGKMEPMFGVHPEPNDKKEIKKSIAITFANFLINLSGHHSCIDEAAAKEVENFVKELLPKIDKAELNKALFRPNSENIDEDNKKFQLEKECIAYLQKQFGITPNVMSRFFSVILLVFKGVPNIASRFLSGSKKDSFVQNNESQQNRVSTVLLETSQASTTETVLNQKNGNSVANNKVREDVTLGKKHNL